MDSSSQDIVEDDTGSPKQFSWYHEDSNGTFNLQYSEKRTYETFRTEDIPQASIENDNLPRRQVDEGQISSIEESNTTNHRTLSSPENQYLSPPFVAPPISPITRYKRRKTASGSISVAEPLTVGEVYGGRYSSFFNSNPPRKGYLDVSAGSNISSPGQEDATNPIERGAKKNEFLLASTEFSFQASSTSQSRDDGFEDEQSALANKLRFQSAEGLLESGETSEAGTVSSFPSVSDHGISRPSTSILNTQIYSPPPSPQTRVRQPSILTPSAPPYTVVPKAPLNHFSCLERKRIFISPERPQTLTVAMKAWVEKTQSLLDPYRSASQCWFHPSPPPPRSAPNGTLRPYGKIEKSFTWTDEHGRHSLVLNYGICAKLVSGSMTRQQSDGWVQRQWHLSHLCGNWSCVNPEHATVESGATNVGRNSCFSHRDGCGHAPKCLKELKAALGADGKLVPKGDGVEERIRRTYFWEDWWGWDAVLKRIKNGDRKGGGVEWEEWEEYPLLADDDDGDMVADDGEENVEVALPAVDGEDSIEVNGEESQELRLRRAPAGTYVGDLWYNFSLRLESGPPSHPGFSVPRSSHIFFEYPASAEYLAIYAIQK